MARRRTGVGDHRSYSSPIDVPAPVLVLEFNELSPTLMDEFVAAGHLPGFRRLRDSSRTYVTDAAEDEERLNPWVQWVTVHTGVGVDEHGVRRLGESHHLAVPTVAEVVSGAGGTVWLCGPMNVAPTTPTRGAWLPDPWNGDAAATPPELEAFAAVVRANVQEHTSTSTGLTKAAYARFAWFAVRHGLRPRTVAEAIRQLAGERTRGLPRGRRALVLDRLQWDVFWWYHRRLRPELATFFSNSTAHFQHLHWGEEDPVLAGYVAMDRLVLEALDRVGDTHAVVLCTGLSQHANVEGRGDYDGFHRPKDLGALGSALGLTGVRDVSPVMAEQFHLRFDAPAAAATAAATLRAASLEGRPAFDVREQGDDLLVGAAAFHPVTPGADLHVAGVERPFASLFYWVESPRAGTHHPDGILWIRPPGGGPRQDGGRVPLTSVAPTLLSLLGVEPPATMAELALA